MNRVPDARLVEAHVEQTAALLGLPLDPSWREGVVAQLTALLRAAAVVGEFPVPEEVEPAPVFRP